MINATKVGPIQHVGNGGTHHRQINFFKHLKKRLPEGLRSILGFGLITGIILTDGHTFNLQGLPFGKGPYKWFSNYKSLKSIGPNWEYYIQVSEYVRLRKSLDSNKWKLTFEDGLMDIGIYKKDKLIVFCEVKEKSLSTKRLINGIKKYSEQLFLPAEDRGNDPLRKTKYIIKHRPQFLYIVSIGDKLEYKVTYPNGRNFNLQEDMIPFF